MKQFLAFVAVENVAYHFDILYGYAVPDNLKDRIRPGVRVQIPFGKGAAQRQGFVLKVGYEEESSRYKKIIKVLDDEPLLSVEMLKITDFLKEKTFCTYFEAVKVQLPTGFNLKMNVKYVAVSYDEDIKLTEGEKALYDFLIDKGVYLSKQAVYEELKISSGSDIIDRLVSKGIVIKNYDTKKTVGDLTVKTVVLTLSSDETESVLPKLTEKQQTVVSVLKEINTASIKELCYYTGVSVAVITTLEKKGIVSITQQKAYRIPKTYVTNETAKGKITLTEKQNKAYENLVKKYNSGGGSALLYGVTGSGKTSVFISLIDKVLSDGKQVIVMVPEISLTPQMMAIFKARYGSTVAIFHSGLSMGERKDEYKRVRDGKARIAVGTRSAVFAPFDNLGLIVMDEEQEHTYKSEASPRYNAKDVARFRAAYHNALVVFSSATPSVESYSMALKGIYSLEKLDERFGNAVLPDVTVVDLKNDRQRGNKYSISIELQNLIAENLKNKKQTILLMNRRGYNTFAACDNCGEVIMCPSCSISLNFHRANGRLMCHYCGYSKPFTIKCEHCGKERVRYVGYGTQRVEEELSMLFPEARLLRIDTDSTVSRQSFEESLSDFGLGKYDILLGTQMVAKGLDFENVTLVGVINADGQLHNDDFRSAELTFDLLTQVVGRSGRGNEKGVALIQTMTPENNIIRLAQAQNYEAFFEDEIKIRKALIYPPYCDICCVNMVSEDEQKALIASKAFFERMVKLLGNEYKNLKLIILPPMAPKVSKVNNKYKYRIIIKCKNSNLFRQLMSSLLVEFGKSKTFKDVTFYADMNPVNLV